MEDTSSLNYYNITDTKNMQNPNRLRVELQLPVSGINVSDCFDIPFNFKIIKKSDYSSDISSIQNQESVPQHLELIVEVDDSSSGNPVISNIISNLSIFKFKVAKNKPAKKKSSCFGKTKPGGCLNPSGKNNDTGSDTSVEEQQFELMLTITIDVDNPIKEIICPQRKLCSPICKSPCHSGRMKIYDSDACVVEEPNPEIDEFVIEDYQLPIVAKTIGQQTLFTNRYTENVNTCVWFGQFYDKEMEELRVRIEEMRRMIEDPISKEIMMKNNQIVDISKLHEEDKAMTIDWNEEKQLEIVLVGKVHEIQIKKEEHD